MKRTLFSRFHGVILVLKCAAFIGSEDKTWSITSIFQNCSGLKLWYVFNELTLSAPFFFFSSTGLF